MENIDIEILENGIYKIIALDGVELLVFENGTIYRKIKGNWRIITNNANQKGYNYIKINGKNIFRHRIIGHTFLNLNIDDPKQQIDHIDKNRMNNNLINLRIVNNQQNSFNTNAKGYSFTKDSNKYRACIKLNGKLIHLGYFITEEEAKAAYQAAKLIYHII